MALRHFVNISWRNTLDTSSHHCGYLAQLWRAYSVSTSTMLEESWIPVTMSQQDVHILYNSVHQATTVELATVTKH